MLSLQNVLCFKLLLYNARMLVKPIKVENIHEKINISLKTDAKITLVHSSTDWSDLDIPAKMINC